MNQQIKKLREQVKIDLTKFHGDPKFFKNHVDPLAKIFANGDNAVLNEYMTKFAELIVRECIGCCEQVISDPIPASVDTWLNGGSQCIQEIKQHFGVEQ